MARVSLLLVLALSFSAQVWATHLRAGEITARKVPGTERTYRITLTTYHDEQGGQNASQGMNSVFIFMGENTQPLEVVRRSRVKISAFTSVNVFDTLYTFPSNKTYKIGVSLVNRNANTGNFSGDTSELSMWLETTLTVNSSLGQNATPILLNIPIDTAALGVRFVHNPGAFDPDGDSLAYRLTTPREKSLNSPGLGSFISSYRPPNLLGTGDDLREDGSSPSIFSIDPITGDLVWDAPRIFWEKPLDNGQVNVAFVIEEWRKGTDGTYIKISETVRDMQIIVVKTNNNRPVLSIPRLLCYEAGTLVAFSVEARDKDLHDMRITSAGGVYNVDITGKKVQNIAESSAVFSPTNNIQKNPAKGEFSWQSGCQHIRKQPYDVLFKVEDYPGAFAVQLVDIKTTKLSIVPPKPTGLDAELTTSGIKLVWNEVKCLANNPVTIIYRRDGCSGFIASECTSGIGAEFGYKEIARVNGAIATYLDPTASREKVYSYRIVVEYQVGGIATQSAVSNETCTNLRLDLPLMTQVSVDKTDINGQISVSWSRPVKINTEEIKPPYQYKVYRSELGKEAFTLIKTVNNAVLRLAEADTTLVDVVNTQTGNWTYKVGFYYTLNGTLTFLGESAPASMVKLTATAVERRVSLQWQSEVPWSYENKIQKVYRIAPNGVRNLIAETFGNGYTDDGTDRALVDGDQTISLKADTTYCYVVETLGDYTNPKLGFRNLLNFSQISCATPFEVPCPPSLILETADCQNANLYCDLESFDNKMKWTNSTRAECGKNIIGYNVYFSKDANGRGTLLATVDQTEFIHKGLKTLVGCYTVTAKAKGGVESGPSNQVCQDNCTEFLLPNLFTPNNDGLNDVFRPMSCLNFTQSIVLKIVDRNGLEVFNSQSVDQISWKGDDKTGKPVPEGMYYYWAEVAFDRLIKSDERKIYKGWVSLVR